MCFGSVVTDRIRADHLLAQLRAGEGGDVIMYVVLCGRHGKLRKDGRAFLCVVPLAILPATS